MTPQLPDCAKNWIAERPDVREVYIAPELHYGGVVITARAHNRLSIYAVPDPQDAERCFLIAIDVLQFQDENGQPSQNLIAHGYDVQKE